MFMERFMKNLDGEKIKNKDEKIECSCGCGEIINKYDKKGRERRFVSGHNTRLINPLSKPKVEQICKTCGKIYFRAPSLANRGKNNYCSNKCRYLDAKEWNGGEKNNNWKGGFNGVQNLRWCPEYNIWRKKVFERDKYICQNCGCNHTRENPIHAHHIIKFSDSIEFAFDVNNGITLCKKCHLKEHSTQKNSKRSKEYGKRNS